MKGAPNVTRDSKAPPAQSENPSSARVTVHDQCFVADRLHIDVNVPAQKMVRLRIVGATEHLLNKNLPATRCGKEPEDAAQQQREQQQKPGSRGRTQRKLITF